MKCSTCGAATMKSRLCKPCQATYARKRRQPSIAIAIVQLENVETGADAFVVVGAPNQAAIKAGWTDRHWGPYKTLGSAQRRAESVSASLDQWAPGAEVANG